MWLATVSGQAVFLNELVGGMFLAFLLDTEEKCEERNLMSLFFYVGLAHLNQQDQEGREDEQRGNIPGKNHCQGLPYILHLVRIVEFPMVLALTYYVIKLKVVESN